MARLGRQAWAKDDLLGIEHLASRALLSIYAEAAAAPDKERRETLSDWAHKCESALRRRTTIECARSDPRLAIRPDQLDADLWSLNCANGTIDLRSGLLHPHRREDLITKLAPVEFDPAARLPLWSACLTRRPTATKR